MIRDCTHPPGFCVAIVSQTTNRQQPIARRSRLQRCGTGRPLSPRRYKTITDVRHVYIIIPRACRRCRPRAHAYAYNFANLHDDVIAHPRARTCPSLIFVWHNDHGLLLRDDHMWLKPVYKFSAVAIIRFNDRSNSVVHGVWLFRIKCSQQ